MLNDMQKEFDSNIRKLAENSLLKKCNQIMFLNCLFGSQQIGVTTGVLVAFLSCLFGSLEM